MKKQIINSAIRLFLAIARKVGYYRILRMIEIVREQDRAFVDEGVEYVLSSLAERPMSVSFACKYFADSTDARLNLSVSDDLGIILDSIPSETTPRERRLLWRFFASMWNGCGDVVEIGPFLGGTSRAIALGMLANPMIKQGRLYTYDRFENYHTNDSLKSILKPLVDNGILGGGEVDEIGTSASFIDVFNAIHKAQDYGRIITPVSSPLPETAEEANAEGNWFKLPEGIQCSAFFVDGCKSWYGTKYFMKECCQYARTGSHFIFQDYLQYTCFWLPSFIAAFSEHFRLVCYVDQTYVFEMIKPLSADVIESQFPDTAESFSLEKFATLFAPVRTDAERRNDAEATIKHALQQGASMAYIGETDAARAFFSGLMCEDITKGFEDFVLQVSKAPTYRPNGGGGEMIYL